jgi:hypothetical protein
MHARELDDLTIEHHDVTEVNTVLNVATHM